MNNGNLIEDEFLTKLLENTSLESPSTDFTQRVMYDIENLNAGRLSIYEFVLSKIWYLILAVMVIAVVALVLYITPGSKFFMYDEYRPLIFDIPRIALNSFRSLFASVKLSPVTVTIMFSIGSIFIADKFIRKPGRKSYMF